MSKKLLILLALLPSLAVSAELIHNFQSPAFIPGNGFSQFPLQLHHLKNFKQ